MTTTQGMTTTITTTDRNLPPAAHRVHALLSAPVRHNYAVSADGMGEVRCDQPLFLQDPTRPFNPFNPFNPEPYIKARNDVGPLAIKFDDTREGLDAGRFPFVIHDPEVTSPGKP